MKHITNTLAATTNARTDAIEQRPNDVLKICRQNTISCFVDRLTFLFRTTSEKKKMEEKYHHHQRSLNGTTFYFLNDENDLSDIRTELERLDATCLQPPRDTHKNVNITHVVADYIDDWDDSWESARERIENFSTTTTTTTTQQQQQQQQQQQPKNLSSFPTGT